MCKRAYFIGQGGGRLRVPVCLVQPNFWLVINVKMVIVVKLAIMVAMDIMVGRIVMVMIIIVVMVVMVIMVIMVVKAIRTDLTKRIYNGKDRTGKKSQREDKRI